MSTFLATQDMRVQRHFEVFEIDLPVINGTCTVGGANGFGTPLTCDQSWVADTYKTYYLTNENAPILPSINGEPIYRCITSINESATELKPGDGLSSRGSLNVTFKDFKGDPNKSASGVTSAVIKQGTFFGKLDSRQIFENKDVRLKLYRVQPDGTVDLANGAETHYYSANAIKLSANDTVTIECKDALSLANLGDKSWPISQGGVCRLDFDDAVIEIPVDEFTDYSTAVFVKIGKEHLQVISVSNNLTSTATLNVTTRGGDLYAPTSAVLLTTTTASSHTAGDEVFICDLSDNETIDSLLTRILVDSDFPISLIPTAAWAAEVTEWHSNDKINTLHNESESVNKALNRILTGYLMDLWFSTTENIARLSAISVHKLSKATLTEGKEINAYTIKRVPKESIRASRALVVYDKKDLADNDDTESFKRVSQFKDNELISPALYGKHKDKLFEPNFLLTKDAADLLTQRYVSRFKFTPFNRPFQVEERALKFKTGDVIDIIATTDQGANGLSSGNIRAQVLKINPKYNKDGRTYDITTLSYEAAFNAGSEIVLDSPLGSVNLYILAGAPSQPIDLTFIFKGSYSNGQQAIISGGFASGSKLTIIMVDGWDGQANGGTGGQGESISKRSGFPLQVTSPPQNGLIGGTVFTGSAGIDIDIYFSGDTSAVSAAYPVADGYIRAPSGGDGGFSYTTSGPLYVSGRGGNGGDGRSAGIGGEFGSATGDEAEEGATGTNGEINGTGSGWGNVGASNDASSGGLAGSGILDNGATITLFGDTPARYINGNGSHP